MEQEIRILSVRQPWAYLIVAGLKPIENRPWSTRYRGRVLIQASLKRADITLAALRRRFGAGIAQRVAHVHSCGGFDSGGIVGSVMLVDCVEQCDSVWFEGPYGFVLNDAQPCRLIRWRGTLGLTSVSASLVKLWGAQ